MDDNMNSTEKYLNRKAPETLAQSVAQFSHDLYTHLPADGNLFFSPFSIFTALSMVYAGAGGETARQIKRGLHLSLDRLETNESLKHLIKNFAEATNGGTYELTSANGMWGQKGYVFRDDYLEILNKYFQAEFCQVDFSHNPEDTCQDINKWAESHTRGKIQELISPEMFSPLTRIILANAVYFKGKWQSPFDECQTNTATFYSTSEENGRKEIPVYMMSQDSDFLYFENSDVQCLEMPYQGDDLAMLLVLPAKGQDLDMCAEKWTVGRIEDRLGEFKTTTVQVFLPQFTVQSELLLADILSEMEMNLLFQAGRGDLSGIADQGEDLFISEVIHKTYVDVTEEGTEAAAATAMLMLGCPPPEAEEEPMPIFRADRPFLFFIRDRRSGIPLFMGRITAPPEKA